MRKLHKINTKLDRSFWRPNKKCTDGYFREMEYDVKKIQVKEECGICK